MKNSYSYIINEQDVIVDVDEAWKQFARDNGSSELLDRVMGKCLWGFFSNKLLVSLYQNVAESVRCLNKEFTLDFRCDGPNDLRFMSMRVEALPENHLRFVSTLLHSQPRGKTRPFELIKRLTTRPVSMCSQCNQVCFEGTWTEMDFVVYKKQDSKNKPVLFQFGMCPECDDRLKLKCRNLRAELSLAGS